MEDLIDTHCHIHDSEYDFLIDAVLKGSLEKRIVSMICVGTNLRSSFEAAEFVESNTGCYASFGLHPHLAVRPIEALKEDFNSLKELAGKHIKKGRLVAIGECGLDYFYHHQEDIRQKQREIFSWHLQLAHDLKLPLIFHVRQAFKDFWPLYDQYGLPGVLHSFSDSLTEVEKALAGGKLYFGLNGIMTFSKNEEQLIAAKAIPIDKLVLETDAPYLTPVPFRGKINKPEYLRNILDFLADLRVEETNLLAQRTTENARALFKI